MDITTIDITRVNKAIGERIASLRKAKKETQADLAKKLSTTQNNISKIENGTNTLTLDKMLILAKHYKVSLDYLCRGTVGKNVLETLNKYVRYKIVNTTWGDNTHSHSIPYIEIEKNYYHYLTQFARANAIDAMPDDIRKQWREHVENEFTENLPDNEESEFISIIPLESNVLDPDGHIISLIEKDIYK